MTMTPNTFENRFLCASRLLLGGALLLAVLAGTACSTDNTEEQDAAEYPNVNKVPEQPETVATLTEAEEIEEGLRADRENARYTDETLRADTSLQPPLADIPVLECGVDFPLATLSTHLDRAHALLDMATQRVPAAALRQLDRVSRAWLEKWENAHLGEIEKVQAKLDAVLETCNTAPVALVFDVLLKLHDAVKAGHVYTYTYSVFLYMYANKTWR